LSKHLREIKKKIPPKTNKKIAKYFQQKKANLVITQSVPSNTALATSETSARVGTASVNMDCNICVAVITGFRAFSALLEKKNVVL
jgi:hypothetical protein